MFVKCFCPSLIIPLSQNIIKFFALYSLGTLVPNMFPLSSHVFPNYVMGFNIRLLHIVAGDRLVTGQVARRKRGSLR
jgi:hypothetical protein